MKRVRSYSVMRRTAWLTAVGCLLVWNAPPAAAFLNRKEAERAQRRQKTQTPNAELRAKIAEREAEEARPAVQPLTEAEMAGLRGKGPYRESYFNGAPRPWQRSLRDVNLCNGNLFKSFTDIQVAPARAAGLGLQRTYNSNDERVGPFGVGWTHAYDIRIEEAGNNVVPRTDFFGGKHDYTRDADGLYSPPPYMFDELSSEYANFLVNGPAEVLTDEQRTMDGTVKHFTANNGERVCDWMEDRHGNRTTLTYGLSVSLPGIGSKSLLTRVTDPSGRYLDFTWSNLGTMMAPAWRITQVQGPFDPSTSQPVYTVQYEYNGDYNLWKVRQDPNGLNRVTTFAYTSYSGMSGTETGLLASIADPLGHTVSYTYDTQDGTGNPHGVGNVWVTSVTEPGSGGNHVWTIDADPMSGTGFTVSATSNGGLYLGMTVDPQFRKGYYSYTGGGSSNYDLHNTWQQWDTSNNLLEVSTGAGAQPWVRRVMTYGPHGNVLTESNWGINNSTTTYEYWDGSKYFQKKSVTDPEGNVTQIDYFEKSDASAGNRGQVKWVRDARYGTTGEQFEYTYNSYGQKLTETNLNNVVTEYIYGDSWGNLTQVVQDPGMGHLNRTSTSAYDVAGRVTSSTDPKSQTSTIQYNGVGQPTQASLPGETITYGYGSNGRTETVTDGRGTTTLTYESGNDRVASVQDPVTGTVSYTHLRNGARATMTLPGSGTWTYDYHGVSTNYDTMLPKDEPDSVVPRLRKITDDQGRVVEYDLDALGAIREVRNNFTYDMGGSVVGYLQTEYKFDNEGVAESHRWLARVKNTYHGWDPMTFQWTSTLLVQNDYTYDDAGNRLANALSDSGGPIRTEAYGYDALNRLTSVNYGDGTTQGYTFDPMGNRLTKTQNGSTESYTYNNANMLLTRGANSYTNDSNGNTLTGGGRTNTWDGQNRLTQCVYNGTTTTHTYGSDKLRRRTVQGATTTDYILDGSSAVRTLVGGNVDKTWLHGGRGPEYERSGNGSPLWYLYDGLGSVLGTVDSTGTVISTRKFDVYGAVRGSTGPSGSKHKFVGSLGHPSEDETGLVYMRARYYDPLTGGFVSHDTSGRDLPYSYCKAAPTNRVDAGGTISHSIGIQHEQLVELIYDALSDGLGFGEILNEVFGGEVYFAEGPIGGIVNPRAIIQFKLASGAWQGIRPDGETGHWIADDIGCTILARLCVFAQMVDLIEEKFVPIPTGGGDFGGGDSGGGGGGGPW